MWHPAHDEFVWQIVKTIQVLLNQPKLPHQPGILKILFQGRIEFRDKERIILRQSGDKGGIDGEVIFFRMAGPTSSAVAVKCFVEEDLFPFGNEGLRRTGRR
jgi:hypothetical protein